MRLQKKETVNPAHPQFKRAHIWVRGRVQGVAFRAFTYRQAVSQGLDGWVQNLSDGRVEMEVEGNSEDVEAFVGKVRKGPPLAQVEEIEVQWIETKGYNVGFSIRQ